MGERILTNPDMVHIGLLPNHERWGEVLANLATSSSTRRTSTAAIFGSHVANVLRRLRRIAADLRLRPAVPARDGDDREPGELGERLLGAADVVIGDDGAPRAERTVVLWNPPLLDVELGLRGSALAEAASCSAGFVSAARALTLREDRKGGADPSLHRRTAR